MGRRRLPLAPGLLGLLEADDVVREQPVGFLGVVQVELVIDDRPGFRVDVLGQPAVDRQTGGAMTAVLRRVALRALDEQPLVLRAGEPPNRAESFMGMILPALHGLALGEIGDGIVTLYRDIPEMPGVDAAVRLRGGRDAERRYAKYRGKEATEVQRYG